MKYEIENILLFIFRINYFKLKDIKNIPKGFAIEYNNNQYNKLQKLFLKYFLNYKNTNN